MTLTKQQFYYFLGKPSVGIDDSIPLQYYDLNLLITKEIQNRIVSQDIEELSSFGLANLELIHSCENYVTFLCSDGSILNIGANGYEESYLQTDDSVHHLLRDEDVLHKLMPPQIANEYIFLQKLDLEKRIKENDERQRKARLAEYEKLKAEFEPISESENE